jgi:hypothetical protein
VLPWPALPPNRRSQAAASDPRIATRPPSRRRIAPGSFRPRRARESLAAMQDWPLLTVAPDRGPGVTQVPLGSTTNGSLPPARHTFLISPPRTPALTRCLARSASWARSGHLDHPRPSDPTRASGKPPPEIPRAEDPRSRAPRSTRASGSTLPSSARAPQAEHLPEREIPGHDGENRPRVEAHNSGASVSTSDGARYRSPSSA